MDVFHIQDGKNHETKLELVKNLCHENEFLTPTFLKESWRSLSTAQRESLKELLPKIPGEENDQFRAETLYLLFQGENMKFGNPFEMFKNKLTSGKMSQRHLKKKEIIKKYRRKKRQITVVSQCFANLSELSSNHSKPHPSISHEVKRLSRHAAKKMKSLNVDERVGKRQITELRRIRLEVQEKGDSSDDEDFIQELLSERDRKTHQLKSLQNWHQNTPKSAAAKNHSSNTATSDVQQQSNGTNEIDSNPPIPSSAVIPNSPEIPDPNQLPDLPPLEEIDKNQSNIVTLEERLPINSIEDPESSYFSLLRYFFCQNSPSNSLTIPDLMEAVKQWEFTANRALVTWIGHSPKWVSEIPSAIAFLCGAFPNAQPPGFVPMVQCDTNTGLYQWNDQDSVNLSQLTSWWLERRNVCRAVTSDSGGGDPQVPKHIQQFREQEKIRLLEHPGRPFVYNLENPDRKVQVSPVQPTPQVYSTDTIMQNLVTDSRVTLFALVQDALSKLPNGKGTLDEITNLVRESQFLHAQADSTTLLKKTAISLTHFQRGHLEPTCSFDPETKQYKLHSHYPPPPPKIIPPPQPQPQVKPIVATTQRNVSHLVQVRTPQGLKLYRLASPVQSSPGSQAALVPSDPNRGALQNKPGGGLILNRTTTIQNKTTTPTSPTSPQIRAVAPPAAAITNSPIRAAVTNSPLRVQSEDNVIVRNPDGRLVQIPRAMLKKLIESGQIKAPAPKQPATATNTHNNVNVSNNAPSEPPPLAPRVSTNDVLNMLPTVPVRQDQLQPHHQ